MNDFNVDWRHISAAVVAFVLLGGFLLFRPNPTTILSDPVPAGRNATVDNDDPRAPLQGAPIQ